MKLIEGFQLLTTAPDGVARLRELILSLAVQGKLVTQDPMDEPATSLLRQVRAERDRLIGEGKIKRDKPLPEIAHEEKPFALPAGWTWVRMQQIADARLGKMLDKAKNSGKPYPYLRNTNVQWHRFDLEDIKVINLEAHELDEYRLRPGDLLICEGGEPGRCAIWREQQREMYFQKALHRVRPLGGILPEYLALCLEIDAKSLRLEQYFTGATIKHFAGQELSRYCVPLPPLAEQSRIVAKVDEVMRLCDELETRGQLESEQHARLTATLFDALATSESPHPLAEDWTRVAAHFDLLLDRPEAVDALEQTILQLAVRGRLVQQDPNDEPADALLQRMRGEKASLMAAGEIPRSKPSDPVAEEEQMYELPKSWTWTRLEAVSIAVVDCPHSTPTFVSAGKLCLDTNSFKQWSLTPHKLRYVNESTFNERNRRLAPKAGDLIFAREGSVGESYIVADGIDCCLGQRVMLFRLSSHTSNRFLQLVISSRPFLSALMEKHKGIGAKHVNVSDMRNAVVALPPMAEQLRIVATVEELWRLCAALRERLSTRQTCQAQLAKTLVEQAAASASSREDERGLAVAA